MKTVIFLAQKPWLFHASGGNPKYLPGPWRVSLAGRAAGDQPASVAGISTSGYIG
jgi:hypothetical protein